jgi:hypothetical protein
VWPIVECVVERGVVKLERGVVKLDRGVLVGVIFNALPIERGVIFGVPIVERGVIFTEPWGCKMPLLGAVETLFAASFEHRRLK